MKKAIKFGAILIVSLLFVTACGKKVDEVAKYEDIMEEYAVNYYDEFQKGIKGMTVQIVYISDLKAANEKRGKTYDLSKLSACKETSYAEFKVNEDNTGIVEKAFFMDCEK